MIKNVVGLAVVALAGCRGGELDQYPHQGVAEYEERDLAFEVSGRLAAIAVDEGDAVAPGTLIARLDDSLARSALAARLGEAAAAEEQLALLRAGARGEDVRAMRARLEAAQAAEDLTSRSAARVRKLHEAGALTPAALEEAEAQLTRAQADRRAVRENLAALSSGARKQEVLAAEHRLEAVRAAAEGERARLERHRLEARHAGEVLEVHLEASEMAPAGVPVVTIAEVTRPYAEVFVPQGQLGGLAPGTPVRARVDGVAGELGGKVELVHRRTEFTPRYLFSDRERGNLVVRVRVRLDDPGRQLHAGVPIFVRFLAGPARDGGR